MLNSVEQEPDLESRLAGTLLGTALGDALGLICEGLSSRQIARRFGKVDRYYILGDTGFISDDTEQSSLLVRSLLKYPDDAEKCAADFKRALLGWFLRMPTGIGLATLRACLKIACGFKETGVRSAGNGSCMRAAIIGVFFFDQEVKRRDFGRAICLLTHTDEKALAAALFVADLAALLCAPPAQNSLSQEIKELVENVGEPQLKAALLKAWTLAEQGEEISTAGESIKSSGYVLHSVPLSLFCLLRYGSGDVLDALSKVIAAGGDTDSNAAILGAWLGAMKGESSLPTHLIDNLEPIPFGPLFWHSAALNLSRVRSGQSWEIPSYNCLLALLRNLFFVLLILMHVLIRIVLLPLDLIGSKDSGKRDA